MVIIAYFVEYSHSVANDRYTTTPSFACADEGVLRRAHRLVGNAMPKRHAIRWTI